MYNIISNMKAKHKKNLINDAFVSIITEMGISMFDLDLKDSNINPNYMLFKLLYEGVIGLYKYNGELLMGDVTFSEVNPNDIIGKDATVIIEGYDSKYFKDWKNNPDVAIIGLNNVYQPDINAMKMADFLTEIDISMMANIKNARYTQVFRGRTKKEVESLKEALKASAEGIPQVVMDTPTLDELLNNITPNIELNNVSNIEKIQYLTIFADDIRNRLYNIYGMRAIGSGKIAQQSVAEINQGTNASWIIPCERLKTIRSGLDMVNSKFGTDWSIEFSECWKREHESSEATAEDKTMEGAEKDDDIVGDNEDNELDNIDSEV